MGVPQAFLFAARFAQSHVVDISYVLRGALWASIDLKACEWQSEFSSLLGF